MSSSRADKVWRILVLAIVEVLNPLLLISQALFCGFGYILSLLAPIHIDVWAATMVASVLLPLLGLSIRARRLWVRSRREIPPFHWRALLPLLAVAALLPSVFFILSYPSLRAISHMDIYLVYVARIFNAAAPPESIFLPGFGASHYWLYYASIAAVVKLTSLDVYTAFNSVNSVFVFGAVFWLAQTLIALKLAQSRTLFLAFGIIFLLGSLNLGGILGVIEAGISEPDAPIQRAHMLIDGADRRLHSTVYKLMHASGYAPGFAAFAALLFCSVRMLRRPPDLLLLVLTSSSIILTMAVMPAIAPFAFAVLAALVPFALYFFFCECEARNRLVYSVRCIIATIRPGPLLAWLLISLGLLIPLCGYVLELMRNIAGGPELAVASPVNIRMTAAAHYLLIPFTLLHFLLTLRRPRRESVFMQIVILAGLALALGIELPDFNQYKFHYLLAVIMALSSLSLLSSWQQRESPVLRRMAKSLVLVLIALSLLNVLYAQLALLTRVSQAYGSARYKGVTTELLDDDFGRRLSAHYWIRDNANQDAVLLVPLVYSQLSSLLSGRLSYVRQPARFFIPDEAAYDSRLHRIRQFFDPGISIETYRAMLKSMEAELPGRPFYAIVYDADISPAVMAKRGASLAFEDNVDAAKVYLISSPAGA